MIDTSLPSLTHSREFVPPRIEFRFKSPTMAPFLAAEAGGLAQLDPKDSMQWFEPTGADTWAPATAVALFEDFTARSRRDAERFPGSARVHANLAQALLRVGRVDEAIKELEVALNLEPQNYTAGMTLARIRIERRELDESERLYSRLAEFYPKDPTPRLQLALVGARRGQWERAAKTLKEVLQLDPDSTLACYQLGIVLLRLNRRREAIGYLRAATHKDVRSPALHQGLGLAFCAAGDFARAERSLRAALKLSPLMPQATHALAEVLLKCNRAEEAASLLATYLEARSSDRQAREMLARAFHTAAQYRQAKAQLLIILDQLPQSSQAIDSERSRLMNNAGTCCTFLKEFDAAERFFARAVELDPENLTSQHNLTRVYLDRNNATESLRVLAACRERFPRDEETRVLIAVALGRQGHHLAAIDELRAAIREGINGSRVYGLLGGQLADDAQDLDAALGVLREARNLYPEDALVANNLAYALLLRGNTVEARSVLEPFPEGRSTDYFMRATWGLLHLWEGNMSAGVTGYQEARKLALAQGGPEVAKTVRQKMHLEVGRAYERLGDLARAKGEAEAGLKIPGKDAYRRDLKTLLSSVAKQA